MKIQMLHTVLHDGKRIPAGEIVTSLPDDIAVALIASGAAVAVDEPEVGPAPGAAPKDQAVGTATAAPTKPEPVAPAAPASTGEAAPAAETGNAKTKGK